METKNKKNDMTNEEINEKIDKILFAIAKKDYEPIPDNIHNNILKTQIEQCRKLGCDGFMIFSCEDFKNKNAELELQNVKSVLN